MPSTRWMMIKQVLAEVLEQDPACRAAYLRAACVEAPDVGREVEALLAASDGADGFFGSFARGAGHALFGDEALIGARVGAYRVEREIARGGMGGVYLAERADGQFQQRVALKILRRGIDAGDVLRRFMQERQILASLNHPNIARLLDGGVTADGRPYFVMEYVEGTPLITYCDERGCSIDERLRLFVAVAGAVQYAHQRLIIHRDLKPSNILVTEQADLQPQVKLLDFGVAKLLRTDTAAAGTAAAETSRPRSSAHPALHWLTPAYASPEQMRGEAVTTATDVYGLGVVLYELLAGCRPYPTEEGADLEQAVLNVEPPPPSVAVLVGPASQRRPLSGFAWTRAATAAQPRGAEASRAGRQRRLAGDLDAIVLKALRKEPARRYASAEALAEDLQRHQRQLPVRARPDTWPYRTRAFAQRHRFGLLVVMLLLVVGLSYALAMARQVQETTRERDRAQDLSAFLVEMFEISDPEEGAGGVITARDLLDQGARRATTELDDQPDTRATLLGTIGDMYRRLGLYDRAEPMLETALDERRRLHGAAHEHVAVSLHALARLRYADGNYDAAQPLFEQALSMRRALFGDRHEAVAATLSDFGWVLQSAGQTARAESLFTEALAVRQALLGPEHADIAESLNGLGAVLRAQGQYRAAEEHYRRGLAMYRRVLGARSTRLAENLNNLAAVLQNQGRYAEAEPHARAALAMYRSLYGTDHPDVATSLSSLAYVKQKQGAYESALVLYREALAIRQRLLGDDHPHVANSLNSLAAVLQEQGQYDQAEPMARRALGIYRTTYGDDHGHVAYALTNLAWMVRNRGDLRGAEPLFRELLAMRRRLHGAAHPQVAKSQSYLASLLHVLGQSAEAEAHLREALALLETSVAPDHPYQAIALTGLGELLMDRGAAVEAEGLLRRALAIRRAAFTEQHWMTAKTQSALGGCLAVQRRHTEAAVLLDRARATLVATRGPSAPETQQVLQRLAALYDAWGQPQRAQEYRLKLAAPAALQDA